MKPWSKFGSAFSQQRESGQIPYRFSSYSLIRQSEKV